MMIISPPPAAGQGAAGGVGRGADSDGAGVSIWSASAPSVN